ncbi:MAG: hypothetical protein ACRD12_21570 [Acidimicrobiales bacterium]
MRQFLRSFRLPGGGLIENPSLLARAQRGADGEAPSLAERQALELAIAYTTIDSNRWWTAETQGWSVATTDNADLWVQPITVADGAITLERGGRVRTTTGGYTLDDDDFFIPALLELRLPFDVRLDAVILGAAYETLLRPNPEQVERARRIEMAMRWITKSWLNSASITATDRLVFLKTASEALTGETRDRVKAAKELTAVFEGALQQEGEGFGVDKLLWTPGEPSFQRTWTSGGVTRSDTLPALEHWYMAIADARNDVVHALAAPTLAYEVEGSAYNGPLVEIADRVLREAVAVELGACGYPDAWRRGLNRAGLQTLRRLRLEG